MEGRAAIVAGDTPGPMPNPEVKPGHVPWSTGLRKGPGNTEAAKPLHSLRKVK